MGETILSNFHYECYSLINIAGNLS